MRRGEWEGLKDLLDKTAAYGYAADFKPESLSIIAQGRALGI